MGKLITDASYTPRDKKAEGSKGFIDLTPVTLTPEAKAPGKGK